MNSTRLDTYLALVAELRAAAEGADLAPLALDQLVLDEATIGFLATTRARAEIARWISRNEDNHASMSAACSDADTRCALSISRCALGLLTRRLTVLAQRNPIAVVQFETRSAA